MNKPRPPQADELVGFVRCKDRRRVCGTVGCIVVFSLGGAIVADRAAADGNPATSNQSLAIEPPAPSDDSLAASHEPRPEPTRTIRRKPAVAVSDTTEADGAVPWYRTGLGALGIVLGLVAVVFLAVRRWSPSVGATDNGVVKVLSRVGLTPKHSLALVQFGRRFVLVGISPDRVNAVCEVADLEEAAELSGRVGVGWPPGGASFDDSLSREATEYLPAADIAEPADRRGRAASASPAPLRDLLGRLKTLHRK